MFLQPQARTMGRWTWYALRLPVRTVVPTWAQCMPLVDTKPNPDTSSAWFWGFHSWYYAVLWVYCDWMLVFGGLCFLLGSHSADFFGFCEWRAQKIKMNQHFFCRGLGRGVQFWHKLPPGCCTAAGVLLKWLISYHFKYIYVTSRNFVVNLPYE
jgi:hypothetical protein